MGRHHNARGIAALALALVSCVLVDVRVAGASWADLVPLPDEGPLPVPPVLGGGDDDPEPKRRPRPQPQPLSDCSTATSPFIPRAVDIPTLESWVPVIALRRDRRGVPGTPPTTSRGRGHMAFDLDSNVRPGDARGNTLLNAHTWPDGTALGNALLAELDEGDELVLRGESGRVCYEVTDRIQVRDGDPKARARYYSKRGSPQVAIIVCSGTRLGPGRWTHRTMWFASPV